MGLILSVDLETNQGPTSELFVRIDSFKVNSTVGEIKFSTSSWLDRSYSKAFLRRFDTDELKPAIGLVGHNVVYYPTANSEGKEVQIENFYSVPMCREEDIEIDILEEKEISKEVPFISFDEEGNEITLYKTVTNTEKVKIGTKVEKKNVYDYTIPIDNLGEFCYDYLIKKLGEKFPIEKINKV